VTDALYYPTFFDTATVVIHDPLEWRTITETVLAIERQSTLGRRRIFNFVMSSLSRPDVPYGWELHETGQDVRLAMGPANDHEIGRLREYALDPLLRGEDYHFGEGLDVTVFPVICCCCFEEVFGGLCDKRLYDFAEDEKSTPAATSGKQQSHAELFAAETQEATRLAAQALKERRFTREQLYAQVMDMDSQTWQTDWTLSRFVTDVWHPAHTEAGIKPRRGRPPK
jgi:hypothetical protein